MIALHSAVQCNAIMQIANNDVHFIVNKLNKQSHHILSLSLASPHKCPLKMSHIH